MYTSMESVEYIIHYCNGLLNKLYENEDKFPGSIHTAKDKEEYLNNVVEYANCKFEHVKMYERNRYKPSFLEKVIEE